MSDRRSSAETLYHEGSTTTQMRRSISFDLFLAAAHEIEGRTPIDATKAILALLCIDVDPKPATPEESD